MLLAIASSLPFRHRLLALIGTCRRVVRMARDRYRPERHYMRGPGPACRARQAGEQR
jgi:hypothetical protein